MIPLNGNRTKPPLAFVNESGEVIPKFAVLKITEVESTDERDLQADKPNGSAGNCTFALNEDRQVADGKNGTCTNAYGAWALYDDADTPAPGEEWGPDDDWLLHKGKSGYVIVGGAESFEVGETTYNRVRVAPASSGSSLVPGEATTAISAAVSWSVRGTGTVQFKKADGTDDGDPVEVESDSLDSFVVRSRGWFDRSFTPPRLVSIFCTPTPEE